jgi:hypothetical protein
MIPPQALTIEQFADLLLAEAQRGIIDHSYVMALVEENILPPRIHDIRGKLLWTISRGSDGNLQFKRN